MLKIMFKFSFLKTENYRTGTCGRDQRVKPQQTVSQSGAAVVLGHAFKAQRQDYNVSHT